MRKKPNQKPTMSDIASNSKSSTIKTKRSRLPSGLHNQLFIAPDRVTYKRVQGNVAPTSAMKHAANGVQVVFDECGCGGTCGLLFATDQEMSSLAKAAPVLESHKGQTGSLSLWRSDGGELLLLAQGQVRWS